MLAKVQQVEVEKVQSFTEHEKEQLIQAFCATFGISRDEFLNMPRLTDRCRRLEDMCQRLQTRLEERQTCGCKTSDLEARCDNIWAVARRACCPGNILYSQITLDEYSDNGQVNLSEVVQDFGPGYQNAYPVAPGQSIRLEQAARPGYLPNKIAIDFALANNGTNYLDLEVTLWLGPGGKTRGKNIGSTWFGNEFMHKDGTQIVIPMPKYRGKVVEVGSVEKMAVEIRHTGAANNLVSAKVRLPYDEACWYEHCAGVSC
jgi:hypothetical protein